MPRSTVSLHEGPKKHSQSHKDSYRSKGIGYVQWKPLPMRFRLPEPPTKRTRFGPQDGRLQVRRSAVDCVDLLDRMARRVLLGQVPRQHCPSRWPPAEEQAEASAPPYLTSSDSTATKNSKQPSTAGPKAAHPATRTLSCGVSQVTVMRLPSKLLNFILGRLWLLAPK